MLTAGALAPFGGGVPLRGGHVNLVGPSGELALNSPGLIRHSANGQQ